MVRPDGARAPACADIVTWINDDLNSVHAQPDVKELLAREVATVRPGTPDDARAQLASELTRWTRLLKDANVRVE